MEYAHLKLDKIIFLILKRSIVLEEHENIFFLSDFEGMNLKVGIFKLKIRDLEIKV